MTAYRLSFSSFSFIKDSAMIVFSHTFLTLIGGVGISRDTLQDGGGIAFSPLYSFDGGGNGGRDRLALTQEPEPRRLLLVGMADRYDVGAHLATVTEMCTTDGQVRLPSSGEALLLAEKLELCEHPLAPRIRTAILRASPVDPQVSEVLISMDPDPVIEYLVITRHPALVQYLREQGIIGESARVLDTATDDDVRDQHVIGILPIRLAALCASYSECSLVLGPQDRGVTDLPIERVRQIAQPFATYQVRRL